MFLIDFYYFWNVIKFDVIFMKTAIIQLVFMFYFNKSIDSITVYLVFQCKTEQSRLISITC
jgi:hypothetical protein